MLRIDGLRFSWGENFHFTYNLSVASGEILAVQGPSGVGKTTLLELIAGFQTPTAGNLTWDDKDLVPLPPWQRPVTTVFQADNLFSHLSCLDNVLIGLGPEERPTPALHTYIDEYFTQLGLEGLQSRMPSQISGGQQQRVAIARALMHQPKLVLADEPTGNLDEATSNTVIELLMSAALNAGATLVVVTHSASIASHLSHSFRLGSGSLAPAA